MFLVKFAVAPNSKERIALDRRRPDVRFGGLLHRTKGRVGVDGVFSATVGFSDQRRVGCSKPM